MRRRRWSPNPWIRTQGRSPAGERARPAEEARRVPACRRAADASPSTPLPCSRHRGRRRSQGADGPARRPHRHQEGRQRGRAQPHPPPVERGLAAARPLEARERSRLRADGAARGALAPLRGARQTICATPSAPSRRGRRQPRRPAGRTSAEGQRQANMNSEDTRNLFLAIALSVLVMAALAIFLRRAALSARASGAAAGADPGRMRSQRPSRRARRAGAAAAGRRLRRRRRPRPGAQDGRPRRSRRARASRSTRRASAARSTSRAASSTTSCSRTIARPSTRIAR